MRTIVASLLVVTTAACVSTQTTAVRASEYANAKFKGVLVYVMTDDLAKRQHYEHALVYELGKRQIRAVSAVTLFPPLDSPSQEQITAAMEKQGLDTVLRLEKGEEAHGTAVTGQVANVNCYGSSCHGSAYNTTRTEHAMTIQVRLVEYANGKTVWLAQSKGTGGASGLMGRMGVGSDLIEHIAMDIGNQLVEARLF